KQRQEEQHQEDDEAPIASAISLEVRPTALVDRRQIEPRPESREKARPYRIDRLSLQDLLVAFNVHGAKPPGFRNRSWDRQAYRRNRSRRSRQVPTAQRCRAWRTPPHNRA